MFKMTISMGICTLSKTNSSPLKISLPTRKGASPFHTIFQGFLLLVSGREYMCFIYTRCAPTILLSSGVKFPVTPKNVGFLPIHFRSFIGEKSMSKLQPSRSQGSWTTTEAKHHRHHLWTTQRSLLGHDASTVIVRGSDASGSFGGVAWGEMNN